jgi:hypothetical protein
MVDGSGFEMGEDPARPFRQGVIATARIEPTTLAFSCTWEALRVAQREGDDATRRHATGHDVPLKWSTDGQRRVQYARCGADQDTV